MTKKSEFYKVKYGSSMRVKESLRLDLKAFVNTHHELGYNMTNFTEEAIIEKMNREKEKLKTKK
jgi:hypothetical protein